MNQGVFFGQMVIGPAGSGKVNRHIPLVNILQTHAVNSRNTPQKYYRGESGPCGRAQRL